MSTNKTLKSVTFHIMAWFLFYFIVVRLKLSGIWKLAMKAKNILYFFHKNHTLASTRILADGHTFLGILGKLVKNKRNKLTECLLIDWWRFLGFAHHSNPNQVLWIWFLALSKNIQPDPYDYCIKQGLRKHIHDKLR